MIDEARKYLGVGDVGKCELVNYYNKHCYPLIRPERKYKMSNKDDWCAMFVSVIAHKCGYPVTRFPYEVSCYHQKKMAIDNGLFTTDIKLVKPGDLILYKWQGRGIVSHVGFIESVDCGKITTIEGNYRGTVKRRNIKHTWSCVDGYIMCRR